VGNRAQGRPLTRDLTDLARLQRIVAEVAAEAVIPAAGN
jgi:hypothetical protein